MLKQLVSFTCILFTALVVSNCSDDQSTVEEVSKLPPVVEKASPTTTSKTPVVYIEELDQYQEYFKEQHETSFSHVTKKNWTSYTAGKNGILTKVLLFGKPNYTISEHYGSSMSGFVRADNPDSGPKLGEWSLSREEIVNQLALQGLTEIDQGWITLQMRGEIPQQKGRLYFIVCDKIGNNRSWFGAFAFAEGNVYKKGRFWLHPDHDLIFRTYVGKTGDQIDKEQRGEPLYESDSLSLVPSSDVPESPKPMIQLSKNFEPGSFQPQTVGTTEQNIIPSEPNDEEPLYEPATQSPQLKTVEQSSSSTEQPSQNVPQANESGSDKAKEETKPRRSLFERYFEEKKN